MTSRWGDVLSGRSALALVSAAAALLSLCCRSALLVPVQSTASYARVAESSEVGSSEVESSDPGSTRAIALYVVSEVPRVLSPEDPVLPE